jgi:hypothetical protein
VERRVLLETLAAELPPDTIQYSSRLVKIETSSNGETLLEFTNGSKLLAQVSHCNEYCICLVLKFTHSTMIFMTLKT